MISKASAGGLTMPRSMATRSLTGKLGRARRWYCSTVSSVIHGAGDNNWRGCRISSEWSRGMHPAPARRRTHPIRSRSRIGAAAREVFLDHLGIEQAHVLGVSWGGILAQEFYRMNPGRVLGLILADTYGGWKGSFPESVCDQRLARCEGDSGLPAEEFVTRWVPEMFTASASPDLLEEMAAIMAGFRPLGFRLMAQSSADTDTTDVLSKIESPTLLLWGAEDRRSPTSIANQFRDAIPNAELAIIANAGHLSNMEQPEEFNRHVRRFCLSV